MDTKKQLWISLACLAVACIAQAHEADHQWSNQRPDSHAPIGVMGDHIHQAGEWMLSYRFMQMRMDGNRNGSGNVSTDEVLAEFMVAPLEMTMDMHMFGAMYAPTDRWTLMLMLPYIDQNMDHVTRNGTHFTTDSSGIGDVRFSGLYGFFDHHGTRGHYRAHLNLGVSLPTGSIDERGDIPAGDDLKLPYPMQLGSGTYDILPGITFNAQYPRWSWGAQGTATLRTGENDNEYTLGNRLQITAWAARQFATNWSGSLRLDFQDWDDIDGADPDLNPMMVPTANPDLRGGQRTDLGVGINFYGHNGALAGHRFALEYLAPVQQDLNGPQLKTKSSIVFGWQWAF